MQDHAALLMFQSGQLSRGAACEFAGIDIYDFFLDLLCLYAIACLCSMYYVAKSKYLKLFMMKFAL